MPQVHPSNNESFRPTPPQSSTRRPTEGELAVCETGPSRFPNLGSRGSFRVWPLETSFPGIQVTSDNFNCIAWSLGHTDRWIETSTDHDMNELYKQYHFEECNREQADVELYRIKEAPSTLTYKNGSSQINRRAHLTHAHRRDEPSLDASGRGCSSKLGDGLFICHNRLALADDRSYGSTKPPIMYGSICQYWRRTSEHPSHPGKEHNIIPATGNYPDDPIFERGYGRKPPGHHGNTEGLPGSNNGRDKQSSQGASSKSTTTSKSRKTPTQYALVSHMKPGDPIPKPSESSKTSAKDRYKNMKKSDPKLVQKFNDRFAAWQSTWTKCPSSSAKARCYVKEFDLLMEMKSTILPLVVYKLLNETNFTAVFLYNALQKNERFLIDPKDVINFLVLQRQSNLIVEIQPGINRK